MSNDKKHQTLGMPSGTANGRLRKNILFHLLEKHEENICVRCGQKIESVDDLSIEHIKPWEGISADLFWDLNNVAFSHLGCNVPHNRFGGTPMRKNPPEGMAWCTICKKFEPVENFYPAPERWNGLRNHCKDFRRDR